MLGIPLVVIMTAVTFIVYLALVVGALINIVVSPRYTPGIKALWILIVLVVPLLGSILWFIWGRRG